MGHNKQFCRPTWIQYKCQPGYCLFIGREAISIKVFIFGHGATTNWLSNKDRAIWFLVTYMEPPAPGQQRSIYLSMGRWAMMTGVKCLYIELNWWNFCTFFVKNTNTNATIQWDRLFIVGWWAMTSDVQNTIQIGLQPSSTRVFTSELNPSIDKQVPSEYYQASTIWVFTSELSTGMWFWKLFSTYIVICIPKSIQNVPRLP